MSAVTLARDFARLTDDELLLEYHEGRDPDARDELVKRFIPFARKLALRYVHSREPLDDLVQVASLGLLNALARFEPELGKKFTSYAAPTIVGELKRHFRDKGWAVHVPRDVQERALAVNRHTERLSARLAVPDRRRARRGPRMYGRAGDRGAGRRPQLQPGVARRADLPRRRRGKRARRDPGGQARPEPNQ